MNTTNVTATITDSDGQVWSNGKYTFTLYNSNFPNGPFTNGGVVLTPSQLSVSGSMNATGVLSTTLFDLSQTQPYGSVYQVTLCSNTSAPCVSAPAISPAGISEDFSAALSAGLAGPRIFAGPNTFAYADLELLGPPTLGQVYYNVISNLQRIWTATGWVTNGSSSGGGSPSGPAGGDLTGAYPNPTIAGIANATLQATFSFPGAANAPGVIISGAPYTGGSTTTNRPQFYLDSGAIEPTTWIIGGTVLGENTPAGFTGNFFDFHINGAASLASLSYTGAISVTQLTVVVGGAYQAFVNNSGSLLMRSSATNAGIVGWASTTTAGSTDTSLSRFGPGVVQIGTSNIPGGTGSLRVGQILGGSGVPTTAAGSGAGGGATASVIGNNNAGQITLNTGTSPVSGAPLVTVTFNAAGSYPNAPYVVLTPANANAALPNPVYVNATATGFTVTDGGTALLASSPYLWNYVVMG